MLIYLALILVIIFFVLLKTGVLDSLSASVNRRSDREPHRKPERITGRHHDPEAEKRLAIFRDFIERLESSDNDDD